ncbi:MAG: hypothetical protein ACJA1O_003098 [Spirosomataceae bacterium]
MNAKVSFNLNSRNKLYVSGFTGNDKLNINEEVNGRSSGINTKIDTDLGWGNSTLSANWFNILNAKTTLNTAVTFTDYNSLYDENTVQTSPENEVFKKICPLVRGFGISQLNLRQCD